MNTVNLACDGSRPCKKRMPLLRTDTGMHVYVRVVATLYSCAKLHISKDILTNTSKVLILM